MSQFLNKIRDVDPNDSEAVKEVLTAFFQNLPKHKDIDGIHWLRALENVINRYPKYCGQHRGTIENYLCHFLDSNNYYSVIEAAKCAHAVQQVRPQQERTASAKSCWREQMSSLCEAAHTLLEVLFAKNANIYSKKGKIQKRDAQSLTSPLQAVLVDIDIVTKSQDIANKSDVLCKRLQNVLIFIQAMLVEIYPVAKPIRPQLILEVILQALSASGNEDSTKVTNVKVQALRTLDALVACLRSNLVPYSALVFRFVMQTLRWSFDHPSEDSRKVRCSAYSSLTRWLNTLHVHREPNDSARSWETDLTSHIVSDVTPPKHLIQLTANAQPMKNLSKKARKKLANSMLMQSNISSHMPGERNKIILSEESNDEVAIAALECAEAFLTSCGIFMKPTTHKQFQELLVRECYNIDNYSSERAVWLIRGLEACRKSCSPKIPPPTQYCLQLYSVLINSTHPEISKMSSQALLDIRLHLHCSPPSLNFALEEKPESKNKEEKRKRVSERNRAVLESLLGQERMPSEDLAEEEVITIPDEPSSKKLRLDEDVSDKISLSSESANSVEITDGSSVEEVEEADLDDSTDYIIEPNILEIEKAFEFPRETEPCSQDFAVADAMEQIDETDGQITQNPEDDTDMINLTQEDNQLDTDNVFNIFNAKTQLPLECNIRIEGEKSSPTKSPPLSVEVAYDYPNTGQEKVTVLEKMDEDNLPSTNDTDDVQITCGQAVKSSQDAETEVKEPETNVPKENGVDQTPERITNGDATNAEIEGEITSKIIPITGEITVEDMLADFVDEVNDESQTQSLQC